MTTDKCALILLGTPGFLLAAYVGDCLDNIQWNVVLSSMVSCLTINFVHQSEITNNYHGA